MERRNFLIGAGGMAAAGFLGRTAAEALARKPGVLDPPPFSHGIASGDPLPDRVVIWTRITTDRPKRNVHWQVAADERFTDIVAKGHVEADVARDHTVKVDVGGLAPKREYFYRFRSGGDLSSVGRTRTAPALDWRGGSLDLGLCSCSNWEGGYFAAYGLLAARQPDLVIHAGDYLYEYEVGHYGPGPAIGRTHEPPTEMVSLADYRRRHAQYKTDPDLRLLHATAPFVTTWDDHESANDAWRDGAENHDASEGSWAARKAAATQAYAEWMPVRPLGSNGDRLYRQLRLGSLAELMVLDLRRYRDEQVAYPNDVGSIDDPDRTILGQEQRDWLIRGLQQSPARWKLVVNPVMITPVLFPPLPEGLPAGTAEALGRMLGADTAYVPQQGLPYNVDQWDGYTADRRRVLESIAAGGVDDVGFLTGDIHSSWACDLPLDPGSYNPADPSGRLGGSPSVAVELVGTSITSDNLNEITGSPPRTTSIPVEEAFKASNRHVKLLEFDSHGYATVRVSPDELRTDWWWLSDRTDPNASERRGASFRVGAGNNYVEQA